MDFISSLLVVGLVVFILHKCCGGKRQSGRMYPDLSKLEKKANSLLSMYNARYSSDRHVNAIIDQFNSLEDVSSAIRRAGLESSNLIFGIDFTASNKIQGTRTFEGRCLHHLDQSGRELNPYQEVIRTIGKTLSPFDEDGVIPAFGFGDASTRDQSIFPFRADGICYGFQDVLEAYNQIAANITLSGPTNFAPLINQAIEIVRRTRQYHILVIVADGQVTSERPTRNAIVEASKWPLSIILVGVGDGPWDMMKDFDDNLPTRKFDNFQFVEYNRVRNFAIGDEKHQEMAFALHALMEIPDQYKAIRSLGLLDF